MNNEEHPTERRFSWIGFGLGFVGGAIAGVYICPDSLAGHSARIVFVIAIGLIVAWIGGRGAYSLWDLIWDWLTLR